MSSGYCVRYVSTSDKTGSECTHRWCTVRFSGYKWSDTSLDFHSPLQIVLAESAVPSNLLSMSGSLSPQNGSPPVKRMYPLSSLRVGKVRDRPENSVVCVEAVPHPVLLQKVLLLLVISTFTVILINYVNYKKFSFSLIVPLV